MPWSEQSEPPPRQPKHSESSFEVVLVVCFCFLLRGAWSESEGFCVLAEVRTIMLAEVRHDMIKN